MLTSTLKTDESLPSVILASVRILNISYLQFTRTLELIPSVELTTSDPPLTPHRTNHGIDQRIIDFDNAINRVTFRRNSCYATRVTQLSLRYSHYVIRITRLVLRENDQKVASRQLYSQF